MDLGLAGARALVGGGSGGLGGAIAGALVGRGRTGRTDRATVGPARRCGGTAGRRGGTRRPVHSRGTGRCRHGSRGVARRAGPPRGQQRRPAPGSTSRTLDEAAWQRAIDGTLWSAVRVIRAALPHLRASDRPAILVVLSSSVREPIAALTTSNLIRPGLAGLIKSLVPEITPVRINGVAPGRFSTARIAQIDNAQAAATGTSLETITAGVVARIPLGRYGDPEELGRVGAFLLSPAASYVTGAIVPVDGGMVKALP